MKNLVKSHWRSFKNKKTKITRKDGKLIIDNRSKKDALVVCTRLFKKDDKGIIIDFKGKILSGEAAVLELLNKRRQIIAQTTINSKMIIGDELFKYYILVLKVFPKTKVEIDSIDLCEQVITEDEKFSDFTNDILVITPSYPSEEHKYLSGFVHSRVVEYKKNNIDVDVALVYDYLNMSKYEFEGIKAARMSYIDLRTLIVRKKYKKILVHFFSKEYFDVLEGCDLTDTEVYVWVHGPETLYWDYPKFTTKYFEKPGELTEEQLEDFKIKDDIIRTINNKPNFKFIFVSKWIKDKSEELINIKFNNYEIIPNIIDVDLFDYQKKDKEKMKKIFMLRRYDNINKYAVDVAVRTILELSKRPSFNEYEFNIYGNGEVFDDLFNPIKKFENVKFHKSFFTHEEISKIHKENGIALFPTRYDAQGVSMCEAGSSGLLVISSDNDAIKEFIPSSDGNIIDTEDYKKYADFIEKVSNDEKLFNKITSETRKKIEEKCSYSATVANEIKLIKEKSKGKFYSMDLPKESKSPVLSIIIPSYNVSKFVIKTIKSLVVDNKNADKIEILVVNDGSKDNTADIVNKFISEFGDKKSCIVKLIDKENGGHGSTINVGIEKATGKYLRIIDGDDWVKTSDFEKLIDILEKEESDIVVTNYCEDLYSEGTVQLKKVNIYDFMVPGYRYNFEDLCLDNYGFGTWGPILATSNIKLSKLKEANFKLSEKTFYVDMEYNTFYLPKIDTITYYDLDIYRYFIGRSQQSVSLKSFVRNVDHHERVINNILKFTKESDMCDAKKKYVYEKLALPMIKAHYNLLIDVIKDRKKFKSFNKIINEFLPDVYKGTFTKKIYRVRKTNGHFIKFLSTLYYLRGVK